MRLFGVWRGSNAVVAIDDAVFAEPSRIGKIPSFGLSAFVAALAVLVTLATASAHGFSENGLRLASQMAWRFACFVFFALLVAGPLCRLTPFGLCRFLGPQRRQLIWGFCAAFGVYLASVLLPAMLAPLALHQDGTTEMSAFVLFSGAVAACMAFAATPLAAVRLGVKAQRALLALAATYFWLIYALSGLARISGPHRPDLFYGLSLSLMIAALILRFLQRVAAKWTGEPG
jgi:hypothetical protein